MYSNPLTPSTFDVPRLFDDHWIPSQLFCRLVDSLFFHLDESFGADNLRKSGNVELPKILLGIQSLVGKKAEVDKLPVKLPSDGMQLAPLTLFALD